MPSPVPARALAGPAVLLALVLAAGGGPAGQTPAALSVRLTSPAGRTGITGPIRLVARVTTPSPATLGPVRFLVDGELVGEDTDGPPYAVEWRDPNPFVPVEITVEVADASGARARDVVTLEPLVISEVTSVLSVRLEALVLDALGRSVNGLTPADFRLVEAGQIQTLDAAVPEPLPVTYTLLIDASRSMEPRMRFVREAARQLPGHLRPEDLVQVVPFNLALGPVTGPTADRETIADAIGLIRPDGGTAILDSLTAFATRLGPVPGQRLHIIVLLTDGYDEVSKVPFDAALAAVQATRATVYVVGISGQGGISRYGIGELERLAAETGGRAFFLRRDRDVPATHAVIASDVQQRYLVTYTPENQTHDGRWRPIQLSTSTPTHRVHVRAGYFAPAPPPIRPSIEFTIRDLNRQFVDVSRDELVVFEDGIAQQVEAFEEALLPVSILLVLDSSGSMRRDADAVMEAARTFVEALPAKDRLAVMQFADEVRLLHDLSTDRKASLEAIAQYQAVGGTALYDALMHSLKRLETIDGRRAVVILTDGRDENNPGTAPGSAHTFDEVLKSLKLVPATVFAIGLGPRVDRAPLERVTQLSGGEAFFPTDVASLETEYARVVENLRRRYIIRYTSTNNVRDGAWRNVEIRTVLPGLVVESRGGYFGPDGSER